MTLVVAACSAGVVGLIGAWALWPTDDTWPEDDRAASQRRLRQPQSPAADLPIPAEPGAPSSTSADVPSAATPPILASQAEAETLKRQAVEIAAKLVEAFPNDAVTYALLGAAHYNSGNSDEAVRWLRKCLSLDPDRADAYDMLAMVASEKGEFQEAVELCKEALKRNPAMPGVYHRLGRALMDLGQTDELVRTMERAVKLPPRSSESHYLLGQGYSQSRDYVKARQSFQVVVGIRPDHTQAYFGLFTACARLGQQEEADRYRKRFLELEALDRKALTDRNVGEDTLSGLPTVREAVAKTYMGAAQIYHGHKDLQKAEELWRKAATLDPNNTPCRAALMALYMQQGRGADALKLFQQLAKQQPDSGINHFYLGSLYAGLRQLDAAERAYRKVTELSPERPEGHRALAELYLRANRNTAQAKTLVEKVVELEPRGANYFLLAVACAKNQDLAGAREAMGRAVELDPNNADYRRFFERLKEER